MRRTFIILVILITELTRALLSQSLTFTRLHNLNAYGAHLTIEKVQGGYVTFSRTLDSITLADMVYITKMDELGNIIWSKGYGDTQTRLWPGWCRSFGMLPDSTFYAGGSRDYGPGTSRAVLYRFDKNGDTIFTKEYGGVTPGLGFVIAYTARATPDGGFVLAGATNTMGRGKHDFYIVKTDSSGNVEWEKAVGEYKDEDAWDMEIASNGDIYVSGSSESFWGTPLGAIQPCVAKLNASGDLLWFKNYNTVTPEFDRGAIAYINILNDGKILIFGARGRQVDGYTDASIFFKADTSGSVIWEKLIEDGNSVYSFGTGFIEYNDGSFVSSGGGFVESDPEITGRWPGIIGRFDSSGSVIYLRSFYELGYTIQEGLLDMIPTPDGIAAVGFATAPQTPWMVKIDSNLCFGPDSCGPNLPVSRQVNDLTASLPALLPYPNPSKDGVFTIPLPKASLPSAQSRLASPPPNMMDPLGSDFPHIHRDVLSFSERKKSKSSSQNFSEFSPIELMAYDLQGRSIPIQYELKEGHIIVKVLEPAPGLVLLKMHQEGKWWFGKVIMVNG
jgi:hypothetical protein